MRSARPRPAARARTIAASLDAVDRHRATGGAGGVEPGPEGIERRKVGIVEQDLHRPEPEAARARRSGAAVIAVTRCGRRGREGGQLAGTVAGAGVGDRGDAALGQPGAERGQVDAEHREVGCAASRRGAPARRWQRPPRRARCQPASRPGRWEDRGEADAVERPPDARAVLDPHRPHGRLVERPPVEVAGRGDVVADATEPAAGRRRARRNAAARLPCSAIAAGEQSTDVQEAAVAIRWMWWSARPGSSGRPARSTSSHPARCPPSGGSATTPSRTATSRTRPGRTDARRSTSLGHAAGPASTASVSAPSAGAGTRARRATGVRTSAPSNVQPGSRLRAASAGSGRGDRRGGTGEGCVDEPPSADRPGVERGRAASAPQSGSATASAANRGRRPRGATPRGRPHGSVVAEADPVRRPAVTGDRHPHPVARPGEEGVGIEAEAGDRPGPTGRHDDVGPGDQVTELSSPGASRRSSATLRLPPFSRSKKSGSPRRAPSGRRRPRP